MRENSPKAVADGLREMADEIERSSYILGVSIDVQYGFHAVHTLQDVRSIPTGEDTFTITIRRQQRMPGGGRAYCAETDFPGARGASR